MSTNSNTSNLSKDFQYNSVREEIVTRIKLRQQLLFFSLTLAGALLALLEKLSIVVFLYPILSMFLALSWIQNDHRIADLGKYIRKYIENGEGWETYIHKNRSSKCLSSWRLITFSNIGSIITAQVVSIGFAYSFISSVSHRILFVLDILSVIIVFVIFIKSLTRKRKEKKGKREVNGHLNISSGSFKIDHPLEPKNKYLYHFFVNSPDMKNVYDGIIATDDNGMATVNLPAYFMDLNKEFRFQLTCIGDFAEAIILKEIKDNSFKIQTNKPNIKVSWQVTGIRKDPYAEQNIMQVEVDKEFKDKAKEIHSGIKQCLSNWLC